MKSKTNRTPKILKTNKRLLFSAMLFVVLCASMTGRPASGFSQHFVCAQRYGDDSSICKRLETSNSGDSSGSSTAEAESQSLTEEFKKSGQQFVENMRAKGQERSKEFRMKACEARKTGLQRRMDNAVKHANKHKTVFDRIYEKVKAFKQNKQLDVADYDTLISRADLYSDDADAAIIALQDLDFSVDCSKSTVAANASAFKEGLKATRTSLKDYRSALVNLIKAVHQAAETSSGQSDN